MNTKPTTSSLIVRTVMMLLTVFTTTVTWAQTTVSDGQQLLDAITDGANIQLAKDIKLSNYLNINGITVTIDLNGHRLYRELSSSSSDGHIFWIHANGNLSGKLTIEDSSNDNSGTIEGGNATNGGGINIWPGCSLTVNGGTFKNNSAGDCGGAIFVRNDATVTINNASFIGNSAGDHGGAIWNNGTVTATNCTFENNTANDVGGIYNSVSDDGTTAGTATLTGCTFKGNAGTAGAGALANAIGNTMMTIDGGTIQNNTAGSNGGAGIWNGGTLNMKGAITVQGNTNVSGVVSNVYLKSGKVITVTGSLEGSSIGVEMESTSGTFTSGYNSYNSGVDPETIFTADHSSIMEVIQNGGEAELASRYPDPANPVTFIERSWDETNKKVLSTEKGLSTLIDHGETPVEGQYKEVTNAPTDKPNEWFGMGGYSPSVPEYYVVRENVERQTIVVQGSNVHLILCNGATLTLTGGLKLEGDNKLYIHCQSYGGAMGRLMVTNKYDDAAGIGSARDNSVAKTVGELVIYGGHIEATGGANGAGIGSCARSEDGDETLCKSVTIYGGYVSASGGYSGAGIGGGRKCGGAEVNIFDGTVITNGGEGGAGIGGGFKGEGGTVTIHGGTVTADGNHRGAGIGGGDEYGGGTVTISGGTVTVFGGPRAAGIGGGMEGSGGNVTISGGTVTVTAGSDAAGIGGGTSGGGGNVTITGGTVIAKAKKQGELGNRAIGAGMSDKGHGTLTFGNAMMVGAGNKGSVERIMDADEREKACWYRTYAEISPCTHPSGITYTIEGGTHTSHCKHCAVSETAEHFNSDGSGTCICGYNDGEEYHTITIATSSNGSSYEGVGVMANVGNDKPYTLPVCSTFPDGYDFAGWVVNPQSHDNGIQPNEGETLLPAGENITVTANVTIFARYRALEISLADDRDNNETLYTYNGLKDASVTLTGRTFYKDGNWNTLCLPFAVTDGDATDGVTFSGTPLEGATVLTLDNATFENSTLTLNFEETSAMEPGKPYLVKWASDSEHPTIVNPVFNSVTISNTSTSEKAVVAGIVSFTGQYAPLKIGEEGDLTVLYLGADNTFRYPDGAMDINAFRAYIHANTSLGDVNGDGVVNVTDVTMLVNHILGMEDEGFNVENADVTRDGDVTVTDVTALVNLILGGNSIVKMVVNDADGITFGGGGYGPARTKKIEN